MLVSSRSSDLWNTISLLHGRRLFLQATPPPQTPTHTPSTFSLIRHTREVAGVWRMGVSEAEGFYRITLCNLSLNWWSKRIFIPIHSLFSSSKAIQSVGDPQTGTVLWNNYFGFLKLTRLFTVKAVPFCKQAVPKIVFTEFYTSSSEYFL